MEETQKTSSLPIAPALNSGAKNARCGRHSWNFAGNIASKGPNGRTSRPSRVGYIRLCNQMHIGSHYYHLELTSDGKALSFRKNQLKRKAVAPSITSALICL